MSPFFSQSAWLCLTATAVLGGMLFYRSKSPGKLWNQVLCLAGLWGGACLLNLSLLWSLLLLSLSCFFLCVCSSDQEFLPVDQKAVLVTGADSGFGHALVKHLDKLGFTVFAGVLDAKGSGAEELRKTCSDRLSVLQMDVTKLEQIEDAHSKVMEKTQDKGLWALVNNAGIFHFPIDGELIPMTSYRKCMAVNFFGAVEVTKVFLPLLRKSKGRLVNVSSMGAKVPIQLVAAYCSTKAALTMFSSIIRQELCKWGVKVAIIQPGGFQTNLSGTPEMWSKMEKEILDHLSQETQDDYGQDYIHTQNFLQTMRDRSFPDISPVIGDIQHAISARNPSSFYFPGRLTYLWICFISYFPTSLVDYILQKCFAPKHMPRALRASS
ncbi:estradiol 17-beta-dehydrogenase 2 [Cricetulus griseus]|uniref:estradiol 17-beta-dehydrogenase 2 n=1 Tax=Cricetulus griseus TaxID=10029 RepID=UPI00022F343E|nr:estradiol 17-beta-dehydrogenase 2 [Cricetulus griseus]